MLKYLKFFRLLAQINKTKGSKVSDGMPDGLQIKVNGPAESRKHAEVRTPAASFFPAVCDMKKWKLKAVIRSTTRS
jgi:predicted nuclease of restriction endonuclease-like RecB superfamily